MESLFCYHHEMIDEFHLQQPEVHLGCKGAKHNIPYLKSIAKAWQSDASVPRNKIL